VCYMHAGVHHRARTRANLDVDSNWTRPTAMSTYATLNMVNRSAGAVRLGKLLGRLLGGPLYSFALELAVGQRPGSDGSLALRRSCRGAPVSR